MTHPNRRSGMILAFCLVAGGLALAGCRQEEQNRATGFQPGTYLGKQDQKLSDDQVDELRYRVRAQRGS